MKKKLLLLCTIGMMAASLTSCAALDGVKDVLKDTPLGGVLGGILDDGEESTNDSISNSTDDGKDDSSNTEHVHAADHIAAKDATCESVGNIEYWYCSECDGVWTDEALTEAIAMEDTLVEKLDHVYMFDCDAHCMNCGELTNEEAAHTIAHVEAKEATCLEMGNVEYWYCSDCGSAWLDEAKTQVTNLRSVITFGEHSYFYPCDPVCQVCYEVTNPNATHTVVHVEEKAATCTENGNVEYWYCSDCGSAWLDEAQTMVTNQRSVITFGEHSYFYPCDAHCMNCGELTNENATHTVVHVEEKEATCTEMGNVEYWYCSDCGSAWLDEAQTMVTNQRSVITFGEHSYTYACDKNCNVCYEETNPNATHTVVHVEAKAATCTENGNVEYWYCSDCGSAWLDEAQTMVTNQRSVITFGEHSYTYACDKNCNVCYEETNPNATHTVVHVEAKAATCTENGNVEYWYCSDCGSTWLDEAQTQITNQMSIVVPAAHSYTYPCDKNCNVCYEETNPNATHTVVYVEAKAATCTAEGNVEYWYCSDCGTTWLDEAQTQLTNQMSVKLPLTDHTGYEADYKCDVCSAKILPEDGTALTIPQALAIAKLQSHNTYTTQKYYITGIMTGLYNTEYGNFYLKDADGKEICIYGLYSADGETRYDKLSYKPVNGDELTVYTVLGCYNTTYQGKSAWLDEVVAHEHDYVATVTEPGCLTAGYTTHTCSICAGSYTDTEVAALGHTTENGECERCGATIGGEAPAIGTLAEFTFGANGTATHKDPNTKFSNGKSYTVNGYTLKFDTATNCYDGGNDAKGNSCMKMGTSSNTGSFTFKVAENVTEVVIYVAQYKANTTKINANGTAYTISTASNNGAYTAITIDTTTNKTISFATVSGGVRCMIDKIVFNGYAV